MMQGIVAVLEPVAMKFLLLEDMIRIGGGSTILLITGPEHSGAFSSICNANLRVELTQFYYELHG